MTDIHAFQHTSITNAWESVLGALLKAPVVAPRGLPCREITGVQVRVSDSRRNVIISQERKLNYRFMVAEWLWIWFGCSDVESIARYNGNIRQFSDNGATFYGAYGPRIARSWPAALDLLKRDPDTRQAVVVIFDAGDTGAKTKDMPCTLGFQFLLREGRLRMVATMRSSDAWLGFPYDVFTFTQLQATMAAQLGVPAGEFTLNIGSSHLYEPHWEQAKEVLKAGYKPSAVSPDLPSVPPFGLVYTLRGLPAPRQYADALYSAPWKQYAEALRATKSADALAFLMELSK